MSYPFTVQARIERDVHVLTAVGTLDSSTYLLLRDSILKAALDEPRGVVVEVTDLTVSAPSAYAVFTSAQWQVNRWPDVPLLLVCRRAAGRNDLRRNGIGRYVAIHRCVDAAVDEAMSAGGRRRRRAHTELAAGQSAVKQATDFVTVCLLDWSHQDLLAAANAVTTELVENAVNHTAGTPGLRVESDGPTVTVAVDDGSARQACLPEPQFGRPLTGLQLVAQLSAAWGSTPSLNGKTVWATLSPEPLS